MDGIDTRTCDHFTVAKDGQWVYCEKDAVAFLEDNNPWSSKHCGEDLCEEHLKESIERRKRDQEETERKEQGFCPECGYRKTNHSMTCELGPHIY